AVVRQRARLQRPVGRGRRLGDARGRRPLLDRQLEEGLTLADKKQVKFAGAAPIGAGTPWGTLALVVRKALEPLGYETEIETLSWGANNPRYVADGRADLGATQYRAVQEAMNGVEAWQGEAPRHNLRLIAIINQPAWIGVAVRAETGITDLADVARKQLPLRLKLGRERA